MSSGLFALLDDVALIARAAAASVDDISAAALKAGTKSAGVVIDDAAVTPRYVVGFAADRELPIIRKIAIGSLRNKILFLLPAAVALGAFAPWAITPLLVLGGLFLAFEGTEKIIEKLFHHGPADDAALKDEAATIRGAIRTDFILSAEIMALTLATVTDQPIGTQAVILGVVGLFITFLVYGVVALIVKADDLGVYLIATRKRGPLPLIGKGLVLGMPKFLALLSVVGTVAMLWVGGGILIHSLEVYGIHGPEHVLHDVSEWAAHALPAAGAAAGWLAGALFSALVGLAAGAVIVGLMHLAASVGLVRSHH